MKRALPLQDLPCKGLPYHKGRDAIGFTIRRQLLDTAAEKFAGLLSRLHPGIQPMPMQAYSVVLISTSWVEGYDSRQWRGRYGQIALRRLLEEAADTSTGFPATARANVCAASIRQSAQRTLAPGKEAPAGHIIRGDLDNTAATGFGRERSVLSQTLGYSLPADDDRHSNIGLVKASLDVPESTLSEAVRRIENSQLNLTFGKLLCSVMYAQDL